MFARPWPDVDDLIRGPHGFFVVFHHQHAVAQIAQMVKGLQQASVVPLVQADAGFIQNIQHPGESASDLGSQPDTLSLSAA